MPSEALIKKLVNLVPENMAEAEKAELIITLQNRFKKKAYQDEVNALKTLFSASEALQKRSFSSYDQARQVLRNCLMILHQVIQELEGLESDAIKDVMALMDQDGSHFKPQEYEEELLQEKQKQETLQQALKKIEESITIYKRMILNDRFMTYFEPETELEKESYERIKATNKIPDVAIQDCLRIYKNIKANLTTYIADNKIRKQDKTDKKTKIYAEEQAAQTLKLEALKKQKKELEEEKAIFEERRQSKAHQLMWRHENLDSAIENKTNAIESVKSMIEDIHQTMKTAEEVYNKLNEESWVAEEVRYQETLFAELRETKQTLQRWVKEKIQKETLLAHETTLEKHARKKRLLSDLKDAQVECSKLREKRAVLEELEGEIHRIATTVMNIPAFLEMPAETIKSKYNQVIEQLEVLLQPYNGIMINFPKLGMYYLADCIANVDTLYWPGLEGMIDSRKMTNMLHNYVKRIQEGASDPIRSIDVPEIRASLNHAMVNQLTGVKRLLQELLELVHRMVRVSLQAVRVQTMAPGKFFESSTHKYLKQSVQSADRARGEISKP